MPTARTIVDIGGQDAKVIKLDENGRVIRYSYNDKCAAGTGRFLEIMADALQVELDQDGRHRQTYREEISISSQCVIFAETEVVSLINEEKDVADILNALHARWATGGGPGPGPSRRRGRDHDRRRSQKCRGGFDALAQGIGVGVKPLKGIDPQINGALGAALIAARDSRA
jgi:activator of 2-hydroxyglutaryl-CoA dehydratase